MLLEEIVDKFPANIPTPAGGWLTIALLYALYQFGRWLLPRYRYRVRLRRAGIAATLAAILLAALSIRGEVEWNTDFTPSLVIGEWRDGDSVLELREDGSYRALFIPASAKRLRMQVRVSDGTWRKHPTMVASLTIFDRAGSGSTALRVVRWRGQLRLIISDFGDPDSWDGLYGFKR